MLILHHQRKQRQYSQPGKVKVSVFWDAKGILLIDYLTTSQIITGQYYANLLDQLQQKIREKKARFNKEESPVPSKQCMPVHVRCHGKNIRTEIRIVATPALFA